MVAVAIVVVAAGVATTMAPEATAREREAKVSEKVSEKDSARAAPTALSIALPARARDRWGVLPGARESE